MTTLSLTIGAGKQSAEYKEIIKVKDKRIKISIKSDSYLNQCHAISYLWSNTGWNLIHSIPYSAMNTEKELRTSIDFAKKESNKSFFKADRDLLLSISKKIIA